MKIQMGPLLGLALAITFASPAHGFPSYIGFSGAPGSSGRCAASCHGSGGGTIEIAGFPTEYTANQAYTITITHSAGSTIKQFNGSCRIGVGSQNAGTIASGTNTATYSTGVETNGIHLSGQNLNSGTFFWTAPAAGIGEVRLYIAGHQGSFSGPNTTLVLVATEQTVDAPEEFPVGIPVDWALGENYPNPFDAETVIPYALPIPSRVLLEVFDAAGRKVESIESEEKAGHHEIRWAPTLLPSGIYFYRLQTPGHSMTRKMLLSR